MTTNVVPIKSKKPPMEERSRMETLIITPEMVNQWRLPSFQRPLRINDKVRAVSVEIANTEALSGVVTLGMLPGDPHYYLVDGQHRVEGFKESGVREAAG
jgi:hypothetical protein